MPKRLHLATETADFTASVSGDTIAMAPGEGSLKVLRADDRLRVEGGDGPWAGAAVVAGNVVWVTIGGDVFAFTVTHGAVRTHAGTLDQDAFTPPMSATVVRIAVKVGDTVRDGDVLISLEAMKMELPILAPRDGIVQAINCKEGELVQPGHVLLDLDSP